MSTYWYFECLDHSPALSSDGEFSQHTDDAHFRNGLAMAAARPLTDETTWPVERTGRADDHAVAPYFEDNARKFLVEHPHCRLGLINEYGDRRALDGENTQTAALSGSPVQPDAGAVTGATAT